MNGKSASAVEAPDWSGAEMTRAGGESVSLVTVSLLRSPPPPPPRPPRRAAAGGPGLGRGGWLLSAGRSFRSESFFLVLAGVVLGVTGT